MNKQHKVILISFITFLIFFSFNINIVSYAEETTESEVEFPIDPTGRGDRYASVLYDNTNGLPTSEANDIVETEEGFLWIGSYSGLIRYDGNTFERYDSSTGISSVVSLFVDSKNRLWIGTNDNGVAVMEKDEVTFFNQVEGLKSSSIRSIVEDRAGNIYVATTHGLGYVDTNMVLHSLEIEELSEKYIVELRTDANGVVFGVTLDGAFFTLEDMKITGYYDGNELGIGTIATVTPDPDDTDYVYIGTDKSELYHANISGADIELGKYKDVTPFVNVNCIEKMNGYIWLCSDDGIGLVVGNKVIVLKDLPMTNSIDGMMMDYEGNVWFHSSRQGVMKVVQNLFTDISKKYNLKKMVVNSTCRYNDTLLLGTDTGLATIPLGEDLVDDMKISMCVYDDKDENDYSASTLTTLLRGKRIRSIFKDSQGRIWLATYSEYGLIEYSDEVVHVYNDKTGFPSNHVRTVYERADGSIMAATNGGLAIISNDKTTEVYDAKGGLSNTEILTVTEDNDGTMYLGSDGDGIYVIRNDQVSKIGIEDGLPSEVILRLKWDNKRNLLWMITSNSIAYMKDGVVTRVNGFPYSNNFDMYENSKGTMWILSSNGVYVVSADDMVKNEYISYVFYDLSCGLPYVSTANSYSLLDEDGTLYMAGSSGVSSVNIETAQEDISEIKMTIPYVEADGEFIYANEHGIIHIPENIKRVTIHGYAFIYSLKNPKISYKLEGFDTKETTVFSREMEPVDYTNLDGGEYTFHLKLQSSIGTDEKEISVVIIKDKAIYEHMWFNIMAVILGVAIIIGSLILYYHKKTREFLKKEEENRIFVREMAEAFAKVIDIKDSYTNGHSTRVAQYTAMLTKELGYDFETIENYYNIALLHDIGKISIPKQILNKPGKLTNLEFNMIKSHSYKGYEILKDISIMPDLAIGAGAHHERPDGKGYPRGLKGDEIPRVAQIIAVADTFDAMYSDRPYRKRMNFEKAVSIIKEVSGTQLESDVVDAFLRLVDKGFFRAKDDEGGGTMESIDNIHKKEHMVVSTDRPDPDDSDKDKEDKKEDSQADKIDEKDDSGSSEKE